AGLSDSTAAWDSAVDVLARGQHAVSGVKAAPVADRDRLAVTARRANGQHRLHAGRQVPAIAAIVSCRRDDQDALLLALCQRHPEVRVWFAVLDQLPARNVYDVGAVLDRRHDGARQVELRAA